MPSELTRSFLEKVARSSGWALSEVESLSLEGERISCLGDSFAGAGRLVYLSLARNNISSLLGIEHLSSLSTAILSANSVSSMDEVRRLGRLPNLRNLDLRLNPIMASLKIGGGSSGSGSSRIVGGGSGGKRHGFFSEYDATAAAASSRGRQEQEDFFTPNPWEMVLKALPNLVNLDGQKVEESDRRELRRRSAAVTPSATNAHNTGGEVASAAETRYFERREKEEIGNLQRSSWSRRDSEVSFDATNAMTPAPWASAGDGRARSGIEEEVVGATRRYDGQDLLRVGTAPSRGRAVAGRFADAGVRKRDRTGAGVCESGGRDEGAPSLRAGSSGSGGSLAVETTGSRQCPMLIRNAAGSKGGGVPPGGASITADDDDLAALWSELGEGFPEFEQPRVANAVAGRSVSPSRSQRLPGCHRRGFSGDVRECRDPMHSPARGAGGHAQFFTAELDESTGAVSFPGASRQTRYGPRAIEPRLCSDSGVGTTESARRRKAGADEGGRRIEAESFADEWGTVGKLDGDGKSSGGGGGGRNSFRGSSGSSRDNMNPALVASSNLVSAVPRSGSSSGSHSDNQTTSALVARNRVALSGRRSHTNSAAEAKTVVGPANRGNDGGEEGEARRQRHPPAQIVPARDVFGRQNPSSTPAPESFSEQLLPYSQRRQNPGSTVAPGSLAELSLPYSQPVPAPTDSTVSTAVVADSNSPAPSLQPVPTQTETATSTVVVVADSSFPAQSGSSSSTTNAAARAVEAFRRSSQRLGLVDASKTGSNSSATPHGGGGVAADGCHGSAPGGPATYKADDGVAAEGSARGGHGGSGDLGSGSPGPPPPVEAPADLNIKLTRESVDGDKQASKDGRGVDFIGEVSAAAGGSSTASTRTAVMSETYTSTALVVPPATETTVSSKRAVSSETATLLLTGGVPKCEECGAEFGKRSLKGPGTTAASACGVAVASGVASAAGGDELHERWWAREKEFTSRWAEREREFDARWTAREQEFDKRRREESKEFTRGMRAMLFEAHNALIASNTWLLERLRAAEAARASPPATETDPNVSVTSDGGSTARSVGASGTDPVHPPPPRRATNVVLGTPPTLLAEADREEQRRQSQNRVLFQGNHVNAPSLNSSGGAPVTREKNLPTEEAAEKRGAPGVRARSEQGSRNTRRRAPGERPSQAQPVEDGKGRNGESGRMYKDREAGRVYRDGEVGRMYRDGEALQRVGDARNSRPLVRGSHDDPVIVAAAFPRPTTIGIEPRETRELPNKASELPAGIAVSSELGPRYRAAVDEGRHDAPPTRGFHTSRHSKETASDAQGERGDRADLERLVDVCDPVSVDQRRRQKVEECPAASTITVREVARSSASTSAAAVTNRSGSSLGEAGGGGGGGEALEGNSYASVPPFLGGSDRRSDGTESAEHRSAFASVHVHVPAEPESKIATLGDGSANRVLDAVLDGEPGKPFDARDQKGTVMGGGVEIGVSGGGSGRIGLGPNIALSQSGGRDEVDAVWRRSRGVGGSGAGCPDPEVTTSAPDG